jgi:hypothetical protein
LPQATGIVGPDAGLPGTGTRWYQKRSVREMVTMTLRLTGERRALRGLIFAACASLAPALWAGPALAQSSECEKIGKLLQERSSLIQQIQSMGKKKKLTPDSACGLFGRLQANGNAVIAALDKDGAWCHVPDQVLPNIKTQNGQIGTNRVKACNVAAQQKKMMEAARKQQSEGGGLLGGSAAGDVLGGPIKLPQGAL